MIIAVDIDGVLIDIVKPWINKYNRISGDNLTNDDITTYYFKDLVKEAYKETLASMRTPDLYSIACPVWGAKDGVRRLREKGHWLVCISHDSAKFVRCKSEAVERYFGLYNIVFAQNKQCVAYDLLIDDSPFNHPDILLAQPWNQGCGRVCRRSWSDIPDIVSSIYYVKEMRS